MQYAINETPGYASCDDDEANTITSRSDCKDASLYFGKFWNPMGTCENSMESHCENACCIYRQDDNDIYFNEDCTSGLGLTRFQVCKIAGNN